MSEGKLYTKQTVSSVGNAWLVTESKSHPGHIYYFNTVTGEAVWNLSEVEIEKARLATHILEQKYGGKPFCPEPIDNPPTEQSSVFKKQTYKRCNYVEHQNTNVCKQPGTNMLQAHQSSGSMYSEIPVNNISAFGLNALNTQLCNTFNVVGTPAVYDSHVSFIKRPQQLIFTPTVPIVSQAQTSLNIAYNQLLEDRDLAATRYNCFQESSHSWNKTCNSKINFKRGVRRNFKPQSMKNTDLRQRLSLRTRLRNSYKMQPFVHANSNTSTSINENDHVSTANASSHAIQENMNEVELNKTTNVGEDYRKETKNVEISSKLDLTALKCQEYSHANTNVWYLVTDFKVLLEDFTLLNIITKSDDHCKLMIPENVMSQLKEFISCSNNKPARCIYNSLLQLIKKGSACTDEKSGQDNADTITNPILNTCFKLLEENHHVVLITNDKDLLKYKKFIKISIFTREEVKSLLKVGIFPHESKETPISNSPLIAEKTNLPTCDNFGRLKSATLTHEAKIEESISEFCNKERSRISEAISTVDAAIQTDTVVLPSNHENNITQTDLIRPQFKSSDINNQNKQTEKSNVSETVNSNPSVKKREIILIRSTLNQPQSNTLVKNNETKPRWRRRQNGKYQTGELSKNNKLPINSTKIVKVVYDPTNVDSCISRTVTCTLNKELPKSNCKILQLSHTKEATSGEKILENSEISKNDKSPLDSIKYKKKYFEGVKKVAEIQTNLDNNQDDKGKHTNNKHGNHSASNLGDKIESRGSSVICVNMIRENITIEESSTSGIISNSESYSESEDNIYKIKKDVILFDDISDKIVTYHIENEHMEESLKTNCEEWVSRFVQIMEDVLSVILIREPMFSNPALPPPWTLHEAAQCIKKYSTSLSVKIFADKLSRVLFDLSTDAGQINLHNMTPVNYMKMYSAGIALIASIKANITDCDEIKTAQNYLQKLLNDIRNPYCDSDGELSINLQDTYSVSDDQRGGISEENVMNLDRPEGTKGKCILISGTKSMGADPEQQDSVLQIRNTEGKKSFFSKLNLKSITKKIINNTAKNEDCPKENSTNTQVVTFSSGSNEEIIDDTALHEPNIVRKFVRCPIFEEQFKKMSTKKFDHEKNSNVLKNNREAFNPDFHVNTFKLVMHMFLENVKNSLNCVKLLCDSCYAELTSPQLEQKKKRELLKSVENAELHVKNLCTSLERMWDRLNNTPGDDIKNALKKAGVDISLVDEHLLSNYWNTIEICRFQAELFRRSIQEIFVDFQSLNAIS